MRCDSATKRLVAVCRICKDAAEHEKPTSAAFRDWWQAPKVGVLDTLEWLGFYPCSYAPAVKPQFSLSLSLSLMPKHKWQGLGAPTVVAAAHAAAVTFVRGKWVKSSV